MILNPGDSITLTPAEGAELSVSQDGGASVTVSATAKPPLDGTANLLSNWLFENPALNGNGWQTADWPSWSQSNRTFMIARRKDAEESPLPVPDAFEMDLDANGGWSIGQSDSIWQTVALPSGATHFEAGLHLIHHVYGGDAVLTVWGFTEGDSLWEPLGSWSLFVGGEPTVPPATRYDRVWRPVSVSGTIPEGVTHLQWELTCRFGDTRDGIKMSGAWLLVD